MNKTDWISVRDKIPTDGLQVLCFVDRYRLGAKGHKYEICVGFVSKSSGVWELKSGYSFDLGEVTHWQRLPENPKRG